MRGKLCWSNMDNSRFGRIRLHQQGRNRFIVTYGLEVKSSQTYADTCSHLGAAIMHRAACEDKLDNRMPGEE
jgi:hypothetical protein